MRFVIYCQDKPDSFDLRATIRPNHLEYMNGFDISVGGPMLDKKGQSVGSVLIIELDSLDAAYEFADADPYNRAGLFESVMVREFKTVLWPTGSVQ